MLARAAQLPLHSQFVLCDKAIAAAVVDSKRPTRSKSKSESELDSGSPLGYRSMKRGEVVIWNGEQVTKDQIIKEIIFACFVHTHRGQQRRYLITFEPTLCKFSINSWVSWKPSNRCEGAKSSRYPFSVCMSLRVRAHEIHARYMCAQVH